MKHFALMLLSVFFVSLSFGQDSKFITTDLNEARKLADSIALTAKRNFKYVSYKVYEAPQSQLVFSYRSDVRADENKNEELVQMYSDLKMLDKKTKKEYIGMNVVFSIRNKGGSEDLEIKGQPEYTFYKVQGKLLDLYPFWKRHVNQGANETSIADKGSDKGVIVRDNGGQLVFRLNKRGYIWDMYMDTGN